MTYDDWRATEPEYDPGPYVCPGCYAVGGEPCAPGCIDAEIEWEREHGERDYADDWDDISETEDT